MEDIPSPYDLSACQNYLERHKNDKVREKYIGERIKQLREYDNGISPYDLSQMAKVDQIFSEARRMFDK
jgi:hypothetical protein